MAAMLSVLICDSPWTILPAWLLLALFFFVRGSNESLLGFAFALAWLCLLMLIETPLITKQFLVLSCKISGLIGMVVYHIFLLSR
jgi:hypothetical protein